MPYVVVMHGIYAQIFSLSSRNNNVHFVVSKKCTKKMHPNIVLKRQEGKKASRQKNKKATRQKMYNIGGSVLTPFLTHFASCYSKGLA